METVVGDAAKWTRNDQANGVRGHSLNASPRFFVVQDRQLLATAIAESGWQYEIAPLLKKLVGV
jgi:hypothetical protein